MIAVPRVGEIICTDDSYPWGEHIGFEGVRVDAVVHIVPTGEIIVEVEAIQNRGDLHSVSGTTWLEAGSTVMDDETGEITEREVLIGFTEVDE